MPEDVQKVAIDAAKRLLITKKGITYPEIENILQVAFDENYGPKWDCFVGDLFVFYVSQPFWKCIAYFKNSNWNTSDCS